MSDLRKNRRIPNSTKGAVQKISQMSVGEGGSETNTVPLPLWSMKVSKRKSEQAKQALTLVQGIAMHLRDRYGITDTVYSLDLAILKNAIEMWLSCKREIDEHGVNLTKSVKVGDSIEQVIYGNPAIRSMAASEKSIIQFFARFGLSPSFAFSEDDLINVPSEKKNGNNWLNSLDDDE